MRLASKQILILHKYADSYSLSDSYFEPAEPGVLTIPTGKSCVLPRSLVFLNSVQGWLFGYF